MRGGFLDIPERDSGIQRSRYERMPECMRPYRLGDPSPAGHSVNNPGGTVPVQPLTVWGDEHRSVHTLADGQVDRPRGAGRQRDGDHLAALTRDDQRPVPALQSQRFDAGAGGFRHSQPVQRQQGDQRVLGR
jgi:hypothetical protein